MAYNSSGETEQIEIAQLIHSVEIWNQEVKIKQYWNWQAINAHGQKRNGPGGSQD